MGLDSSGKGWYTHLCYIFSSLHYKSGRRYQQIPQIDYYLNPNIPTIVCTAVFYVHLVNMIAVRI